MVSYDGNTPGASLHIERRLLGHTRSRIFWKYVRIFIKLVGAAMLLSGAIDLYFTYRDQRAAVANVERQRAESAAAMIERFINGIHQNLRSVAKNPRPNGSDGLSQRRFDYVSFLKFVPSVTEIAFIAAEGKEQLRVSRSAVDLIGLEADYFGATEFQEAKVQQTYFSPIYFRNESEPYLTIAVAGKGSNAGVVIAEVNLKFIWDVVSDIRVGESGHAYVVDSSGILVSHPDIGLVLQRTSLASLPQVQKAITASTQPITRHLPDVTIARDLQGHRVLSTSIPIRTLRWQVFVEQPLHEAFGPLYISILRTGLLMSVGFVLAVAAGMFMARKMVTPIGALQAGAARIGAGALDQSIIVDTGDELEELGEEFNRMSARLRDSYANLERQVEDRTQEFMSANEGLKKEIADRKRAEETERLRTLELEALVHIASILVQPNSFEEKCKYVLDEVAHLVQADWVTLRVPEAEGLRLVTVAGPATLRSPLMIVLSDRETLALDEFQNGQPVLVNDYSAYPQASSAYLSIGVQSMVLIPVKASGPTVGLVNVLSREPNHFTPDRVRVLTAVADGLGVLLENAQAHATALQASAAKSDFLSSMSHELRTPLNAIIGYSEMLQEQAEDLDQVDFIPDLQKVQVAGKHLLALVSDILDLSKIESGEMDLYLETFSISQVIEDTASVAHPLAEKNGNTLEVHCPDDAGYMRADMDKVRQTLFNVLSNACKFTKNGIISLKVTRRPEEGIDWVSFRVTDTGIGIAPESLGKLFQPFTQADDVSTTRQYGGTGLGLALSQQFCQIMGETSPLRAH